MYLDNAATTELLPQVKDYIIEILDDYGNPSSNYEIGNKTKQIIEKSRSSVQSFINSRAADNIIFTSSGSSANTLAIKGYVDNIKQYSLYYSPISHKSMLLACQSCRFSYPLKVNDVGEINLKDLKNNLKKCTKYKPIVCLEVANSEIGTINNIKYITDIVHKYNGIVIADFTGYIPSYKIDVQHLDVDIATFSAHKLGALKGVGILYKKENIKLSPLVYGAQEQGLFGGTENVLGIASVGKAIEYYDYSLVSSENRDYLLDKLLKDVSDCYLIGSKKNRLPHNLYICFKGINASILVGLLDTKDIQLSTGSACNNGDLKASNTLTKIGINTKDIHSCIRISLNGKETKNDLDYLCKVIKTNVELCRILYR